MDKKQIEVTDTHMSVLSGNGRTELDTLLDAKVDRRDVSPAWWRKLRIGNALSTGALSENLMTTAR